MMRRAVGPGSFRPAMPSVYRKIEQMFDSVGNLVTM
jgi:hypothetical protein